jgi:hypothetical protein
MKIHLFRRFLDWLSGAIMLSGLWLIDEILTLAKYCGKDCVYPIPLIGSWGEYDVESFAWVMILVGALLLYVNKSLESLEHKTERIEHTTERTEHGVERQEHVVERKEHETEREEHKTEREEHDTEREEHETERREYDA